MNVGGDKTEAELFEEAWASSNSEPQAIEPPATNEPPPGDAPPAPPQAPVAPAAPTNPANERAAPEGETGNAAPTATEDDWIASLPLDAQERVRKEIKDREDRFKALHGRVAPLQQALNEAQRTLNQRQQTQQTAAPAMPDAAASRAETDSYFDSEQWKRFEDDFPGDAKVMRAALERQQAVYRGEVETLRGRLEKIEQSAVRAEQVVQQTELAEQQRLLSEQHPDWQEVNGSDEFWDWFDSFRAGQPEEVRGSYYDEKTLKRWFANADFAGRMITYFKRDTGSVAPPPAPPATTNSTQPADAPPAAPAAPAPSVRQRMGVAPDIRGGAVPPSANPTTGMTEREQFEHLWKQANSG